MRTGARTLESICVQISSGGTPSRGHTEYFSGDSSGHLWVKSKELRDGSIGDTEEKITDAGLKSSAAKYFPANTVLVAMYGANVGQLGWLRRPATVNQAICGLVIDESQADWRFVFYALLHNRGDLIVQAQGAAQQNLNQGLVRRFQVGLPPLDVQRRIAGILSAYDDLVENCERRIRVLDEMARSLYREWFVLFRYPGHEKVPLVDSSLGAIPKGWDVTPLPHLAAVKYGKNLPVKRLSDDAPFPVYGAAKIIGRYTEYTRADRSIICGCRGSVGEMQITQPMCFVTNNAFTFDPTSAAEFLWLFHALAHRGLRDVVGGAAQPQITIDGISSVTLGAPSPDLRRLFHRQVSPLCEGMWALDGQVQNLRRSRDFLLPRLLSGQLAVEDAA